MRSNVRTSTICQLIATLVLVLGSGLAAFAQERLPPIPPARMTEAQKQAAAAYEASRGQPPARGPFAVMLRSPEVMTRALALSDYLRIKGVLPAKLRLLAILLAARQWTAQFEWAAQYPQAIQAGVSADVANAIAAGRRPDRMTDDEGMIYDFCTELQRNQSVSDLTYNRVVAKFGEQGVVEAVSTVGYFTYLGMLLNTARTPAPAGPVPPLEPFLR